MKEWEENKVQLLSDIISKFKKTMSDWNILSDDIKHLNLSQILKEITLFQVFYEVLEDDKNV